MNCFRRRVQTSVLPIPKPLVSLTFLSRFFVFFAKLDKKKFVSRTTFTFLLFFYPLIFRFVLPLRLAFPFLFFVDFLLRRFPLEFNNGPALFKRATNCEFEDSSNGSQCVCVFMQRRVMQKSLRKRKVPAIQACRPHVTNDWPTSLNGSAEARCSRADPTVFQVSHAT